MLQPRSLKTDLFALGILAATIFLAASLLSYDPADPPSNLTYPERAETLNACGRYGAQVSTFLFTAIGVGAYYLVLSLAVLDAALLMRRTIGDTWLRLAGWFISLVGLTALASMVAPQLSPGPVIGSGGYLGAAGGGLLEMNFARLGASILAVSLVLGGLLLCTDYLMLRAGEMLLVRPLRGVLHGIAFVAAGYGALVGWKPAPAQASRKRTDIDKVAEEVAVRIARRKRGEEESEEEPVVAEAPPAPEPVVTAPAKEKPVVVKEPAVEKEPSKAAPRKSLAEVFWPRKEQKQKEKSKEKSQDAPPQRQTFEELDAETAPVSDTEYELPTTELLLASEPFSFEAQEEEVRRKAKILEKTFANFGFNIRVVEIQTGPVIAQFEVELEAGLRLSKITGLADDLAIALRVPSVRIVAPIPGKNTVGVEVPNNERQLVRMREVMEEANGKAAKMRIPLFLGKDVAGNSMVVDLTTLPHLLIAGRTGTGKSVCLNTIIVSMIMTRRPDEVRMLMIDPKMVELSPYKCLPHLMHPVVTDMRKAEAILGWAVEKMEERYQLLARAGVRHLSVYNQLGEEELMERMRPQNEEERRAIPLQMPYIVVVADEMADLMMTAAKEVEGHIIRLAQKSRAVGIHLVLATQKPTVDVITGLIKSNLPARISFQVASRTDSRVVLDEMGADKLLGNGDMLFLWPGTSTLIRGQGTYLSDDEINRVIGSVATAEPEYVKELVQLKTDEPQPAASGAPSARDELYDAAVDIVIREGRGSVSLLQRALGIGYGRAARLIDFMAEDGIVGTYNGSQAREVVISLADWEARQTGGAPTEMPAAAAPPAGRRPSRILLASEPREEPAPSVPARPKRTSAPAARSEPKPKPVFTPVEEEPPFDEDDSDAYHDAFDEDSPDEQAEDRDEAYDEEEEYDVVESYTDEEEEEEEDGDEDGEEYEDEEYDEEESDEDDDLPNPGRRAASA
jgi:S-DNA-T family DNA segregation ATPase FtsK/SpoIIIE